MHLGDKGNTLAEVSGCSFLVALQELVTMQRRMQDMEDHFKAREAELKDDITMKAREMVALKREVEEAHMARNTDGRRTKEQADDLLMQVLSPSHGSNSQPWVAYPLAAQ